MDTRIANDGNSPKLTCGSLPPSSKTVEVSFREQAKTVVAEVSIRVSGPTPLNSEDVLKESYNLFLEAFNKSQALTMRKQ